MQTKDKTTTEAPSFMTLSPTEKAGGFRLVRFLDQIILLNKEGKAERRSFFPSRNAAKKANREWKKLRVVCSNPANSANCQNTMVPDLAPIRPTKAQQRLTSRIDDFGRLKPRYEGQYTKPGSLQK